MPRFVPAPVLEQLTTGVVEYPVDNPQYRQGAWTTTDDSDLVSRLWKEGQWSNIYGTLLACLQGDCPAAAEQLKTGCWGDLNQALDSQIASATDPKSLARLHFERGCLLLLAGKWLLSAGDLRKAAELDPDSLEYAIVQAMALERSKEWEAADQVVGRTLVTLKEQPDLQAATAFCIMIRVGCLVHQRRRSEVFDSFQQALDIYSKLAKVRPDLWSSAIAGTLIGRGLSRVAFDKDYMQAAKDFRKAVDWAERAAQEYPAKGLPLLAAAHRSNALALAHAGHEEKCFTAYDRALDALRRATPYGPTRREDLLRLYLEYGRVLAEADSDATEQNYFEAIQTAAEGALTEPQLYRPWQAEAQMTLACVYSGTGDARAALRHYQEAIRLLEQLIESGADVKFQLSTAYHGVGTLLVESRLWNDGAAALEKSIAYGREAGSDPDLADQMGKIGLLVCDARRMLASARLSSGLRNDAEKLLFDARAEARHWVDLHPRDALCAMATVEGDLLAIYANEKRFDAAETVVRESMDFLRPYAQREPENFGDTYAMQAKYLILLLATRKAPDADQREIAREAASLARQPIIKEMMVEIARGSAVCGR